MLLRMKYFGLSINNQCIAAAGLHGGDSLLVGFAFVLIHLFILSYLLFEFRSVK